jgi:hypothetical protein
MLCQRCGEREAEIFQTQRSSSPRQPGAPPLTPEAEREVRRVLDEAAPVEDDLAEG